MKKKLFSVLFALVLSFGLVTAVPTIAQAIWYVDDDGTPGVDCDFNTIQKAIDTAGLGDTIIVAAGTYTEYLHITTDGLTIEGAGMKKSIIGLDGLTPYWHYPSSGSYASKAGVLISGYLSPGTPADLVENVTFRGFTVTNAGLNPPITATGTHTGPNNQLTTLTDNTKSWTPNALIGLWVHNYGDRDSDYKPARSYGQITANTVNTVTVVFLSGGQENDWDTGDQYLIAYEHFHSSYWVHRPDYDGVRGISIGNGKNILIQNCKVVNSGYGGITVGLARNVRTHKYSEGVTIDNCISSDHPVVGIGVGKYYRGSTTITNNVCENNGQPHYSDATREYMGHGIQVAGNWASDMVSGIISNNTVRNNGFEGIVVAKYTDGVIVENNTVTGHNFDEDGAGIFMYHWGQPEWCTNHIVRNNKVTGNHRGIIAYYASNCVIEGNNIETDSGGWYAGPGIKLDQSNNIEVMDNHMHGVEGHAILVTYSDENDIHDNILNNNGRTGIYLYYSDWNEVCDNIANSNEYGIKVESSDDNNIEKNKVHASDEYDLYEEGSTDNTWVNNKYKTKNW